MLQVKQLRDTFGNACQCATSLPYGVLGRRICVGTVSSGQQHLPYARRTTRPPPHLQQLLVHVQHGRQQVLPAVRDVPAAVRPAPRQLDGLVGVQRDLDLRASIT